MTNTQKFAKRELDILAATVPDAIVTPFAKEILALCEKFGKSGQSGGSAPYTATAISKAVKKLLLQEPISVSIHTTDLIVIGDLHGLWDTLFYYIKQLELNDTTIIVAGDCGFGFEKPEYYTQTYNKFKKYLLENNVHILFIRGNHDDPSYFNGDNVIDLPHFKTLKDYTVLEFNDKKILCIGGGVSIDRTMRTSSSYWYGEEFIFNAKLMPVEPITHIITHVFYALPQLCKNGLVEEFSKHDDKLILALDTEKKNVELLFNFIKEKGWDIEHWYFGHYHKNLDFLYEGIECSCIDMLQFKHKLSYKIIK